MNTLRFLDGVQSNIFRVRNLIKLEGLSICAISLLSLIYLVGGWLQKLEARANANTDFITCFE